jgi:hypothetical protein
MVVSCEGLLVVADAVAQYAQSLNCVAYVVAEAHPPPLGIAPGTCGPHLIPVWERVDGRMQPEVLAVRTSRCASIPTCWRGLLSRE